MGMPKRTEPEIKRVSLTFALLHLLAAGQEDVTKFEYMDRPERDSRKLLLLSKRFPSLSSTSTYGLTIGKEWYHSHVRYVDLTWTRSGIKQRQDHSTRTSNGSTPTRPRLRTSSHRLVLRRLSQRSDRSRLPPRFERTNPRRLDFEPRCRNRSTKEVHSSIRRPFDPHQYLERV